MSNLFILMHPHLFPKGLENVVDPAVTEDDVRNRYPNATNEEIKRWTIHINKILKIAEDD